MNPIIKLLKKDLCRLVCLLTLVAGPMFAQSESAQSDRTGENAVDAKINALSESLGETRAELAESREEIRQLRSLLEEVSQRVSPVTVAEKSAAPSAVRTAEPNGQVDQSPDTAAVQNPARISQDDWDVLNGRLEEQRQVKVESSSKFPLQLSGMVLLNSIVSSGRVDNFDLPTIAVRSTGSSGATGFSVRQSIIGLQGTGPTFLGAATSADLQADFFGGLPYGYGESTSGLMRLRLARMRMDWAHTSIIAGYDTLFFSPDSPTSYLTVAEPAFSAAGNLWTWSPTVRIEQRFDTSLSQFKVEAGILDVPSYTFSNSEIRIPSPGESSRQPAYSVRVSANGRNDDRPVSLGLSGIYLSQRFPGSVNTTGSGGTVDWKFPLFPGAEFSGELFLGKGLDGFGAAPVPALTTQNYLQYITVSAPALAKMTMFGGWSQLKFRVDSRGEVNVAVGGVSRSANAFRQAALTDPIIQGLAFKNEMLMINYVYRPRSDLIFSAEYRRLWTYQISGPSAVAGVTGLTAGFVF